MSSSYTLEINHQSSVTGPLALVAPQAAEAGATGSATVRVVDALGRAAVVTRTNHTLNVQWDEPNELFPTSDGPPQWVERLRSLIGDLRLNWQSVAQPIDGDEEALPSSEGRLIAPELASSELAFAHEPPDEGEQQWQQPQHIPPPSSLS